MASLESGGQDFTLDCLPLDCIICICEYLSAEDLGKFSRVCRVSRHVCVVPRWGWAWFVSYLLSSTSRFLQLFHDATLIGYLWRFVV